MGPRDGVNNQLGQNLADFFENGPGLRSTYGTWIAAKDTANGYVLLSGLGGMGVGSMWSRITDGHVDYPGWVDAPDVLTAEVEGLISERRIINEYDSLVANSRTAFGRMAGRGEVPTREEFYAAKHAEFMKSWSAFARFA
jgi:hypothetical protein